MAFLLLLGFGLGISWFVRKLVKWAIIAWVASSALTLLVWAVGSAFESQIERVLGETPRSGGVLGTPTRAWNGAEGWSLLSASEETVHTIIGATALLALVLACVAVMRLVVRAGRWVRGQRRRGRSAELRRRSFRDAIWSEASWPRVKRGVSVESTREREDLALLGEIEVMRAEMRRTKAPARHSLSERWRCHA